MTDKFKITLSMLEYSKYSTGGKGTVGEVGHYRLVSIYK